LPLSITLSQRQRKVLTADAEQINTDNGKSIGIHLCSSAVRFRVKSLPRVAELSAINYNSALKENEGAPEISASINSISTINDCIFIRHSTR
jgi:hypothetical protein